MRWAVSSGRRGAEAHGFGNAPTELRVTD
jgi:hypothetical protein